MTYVTMDEVRDLLFRPATEDDDHLPGYDYTRMTAVSTCPTWGILRYKHNKKFQSNARAMALEAGHASHEVYAARRLWQLWKTQGLQQHAEVAGLRCFGEHRWEDLCRSVDDRESDRHQMLSFCLAALYNSGFYDDPQDKRRTMANIEEALIAYLDRWSDKYPIYVQDDTDPKSFVGVEIPVNVVVTYVMHDGDPIKFRLIGRADGLQWHRDKLTIHENKTASRLGDAWAQSFDMSHQVTGYCLGVSTIVQHEVNQAQIMGMSIPLPRSYDYGGLMNIIATRNADHYKAWAAWALHTVQVIEQWKDDVMHAPKFTHSCNRYFRPCSFIPFCTADDEEKELILSEMVHDEWNPLAEDDGS